MLKVVRVLVVFSLLIFPAFITSEASQQDTPLMATVSVRSVFKITLQATMLDFGTVDPGTKSSEKTIGISCVTNNNNAWSVSVNAESPFSSGEYEIPISQLKWKAAATAGTGQVTDSGETSLTPENFYMAGMDEYITETPVQLAFTMFVDVPGAQPAGTYSTVVIVTMHEE